MFHTLRKSYPDLEYLPGTQRRALVRRVVAHHGPSSSCGYWLRTQGGHHGQSAVGSLRLDASLDHGARDEIRSRSHAGVAREEIARTMRLDHANILWAQCAVDGLVMDTVAQPERRLLEHTFVIERTED